MPVDIEAGLEEIYERARRMSKLMIRQAEAEGIQDPEFALAISKFMDTEIRALDRLMALRYKLKQEDITSRIDSIIEEILARAQQSSG